MNTLAISTRRDDTWLPTAVALILSLLLHVGVFTGMLSSWQIREQRQKQKQEDQPAEKVDQQLQVEPEKNQPQEDELLLGKDDADDILTLNWIGYEAFEKLIAMPSKTQQAALQRLADPVNIPINEVDPASDVISQAKTEPRPQSTKSPPSPTQAQVSEQVESAPKTRKPVDTAMPLKKPDAVIDSSPLVDPTATAKAVTVPIMTPQMDVPQKPAHEQPLMTEESSLARIPQPVTHALPEPAPNPEKPMPKRVEPAIHVQPKEQTRPAVSQQQQQDSQAQPYHAQQLATQPRPTVMPRDERESQPYSLDHHEIEGKIGGVIVGKGIEIQTRVPRFTAVTKASIWPKANPVVEITFATDGVVITAEILRSSGYAGIDSPILTSVYHWKAKGELLKKVGRPFKRKFTFRLLDETID